jgi:hypothetical protein
MIEFGAGVAINTLIISTNPFTKTLIGLKK